MDLINSYDSWMSALCRKGVCYKSQFDDSLTLWSFIPFQGSDSKRVINRVSTSTLDWTISQNKPLFFVPVCDTVVSATEKRLRQDPNMSSHEAEISWHKQSLEVELNLRPFLNIRTRDTWLCFPHAARVPAIQHHPPDSQRHSVRGLQVYRHRL